MNILICIAYLFTAISFTKGSETIIEFNHGTLELMGGAPEIKIHGHAEQYLKVIVNEGPQLKSGSDYIISKNKKKMRLTLLDAQEFVTIYLPPQVDLECSLNGIVFEGRDNQEFRKVSFNDVAGDIEFTADGYDVTVKNAAANVSIVTYGDIEGWFDDFEEDVVISLDTYWGNVKAHVPLETTANVNLISVSGEAIIDKQFNVTRLLAAHTNNFIGEINGGGMNIILHSEAGQYVHLEKL